MKEFLWMIQLLIGMIALTAASGVLISALIRFARSLGIKEYIIAFILVGFASAFPELIIATNAYLYNIPELIFANAIGTSIVSLSLISGMIAIFKHKFNTKKLFSTHDYPILTLAVALPVVFSINGVITRLEGFILLATFGYYIFNLFFHMKNYKLNFPEINYRKSLLLIAISLTLFSIFLIGEYIVFSMNLISNESGLSIFMLTVVFLAPLGAIPELVYEFNQYRLKKTELTFGDLFTSVVINTTFILGLFSIIKPIHILINPVISFASLFLIVLLLVFNMLMKSKNVLTWKEGVLLVVLFAVFSSSTFLIYISSL